MRHQMGFTGEASDHKIAGIFNDTEALTACQGHLIESVGLQEDQIKTLRAGDRADGKVLEPESRGIWHTLIRAHVWLALAGAVIGVMIFFLLSWLDITFVVRNPMASFLLLVVFCTAGFSMVGGAVTLRPDHTPYIVKVKEALENDQHVLVIHPTDREQMKAARKVIASAAEETVATL